MTEFLGTGLAERELQELLNDSLSLIRFSSSESELIRNKIFRSRHLNSVKAGYASALSAAFVFERIFESEVG